MNNKLINNAVKGDKKALAMLIKSQQNNIYSTLFYLNKNHDDLSDIVQNVLIKLSRKIQQLKNPDSFKTWLNQIIVNTYYDYLRKKKGSKEIVLSPDDNKFDLVDTNNNPQSKLLQRELDLIIKTSISNLPVQYKIPLTLREVQGLSYSDISNVTQTSIGTVKSRISRARILLQNDIKKYTKE